MKKACITIFVFVLSFLSFNPYTAICQVVKGKSEISIGIGCKSIYELISEFTVGDNNYYSRSPVYSMSYRYHLTKRLSVGLNFAWQHFVNYDVNVFIRTNEHKDVSSITFIAPEITFCYIDKAIGAKKNELRVYGLVSAGIAINHERDNYYYYYSGPDILPALQITPIGARFGKALAGFCELGIGNKGLINIGLSYRFTNKKINTNPS